MIPSADMIDAAAAILPDAQIRRAGNIAGGSSALVVALEVEQHETVATVVFRQHRGRLAKGHGSQIAAKEFDLLERLSNLGFEVPKPLALHGPKASGGPWLVTEWVEGTTEIGPDDVADAVSQMGDFLARLHALDIDGLSVRGLAGIEDPAVELVRYLPGDDIGQSVERALTSGIDRHPNRDVLLHGDYWPGNVMFDNGTLVAVLDWEDAQSGDPLADLACARIELTCAYGPTAADDFTTRLVQAARRHGRPLDLSDLPLWESYSSAAALSSMHQWGLSPNDETNRRRATRAIFDRAAKDLVDR